MMMELDICPEEAWLANDAAAGIVEVRSPASGEHIAWLRQGGADDVAEAACTARRAQVSWFALPYEQRAAILYRAAQLVEDNSELYVKWLVRETGSVHAKAAFEVGIVVKVIREAAAMPSQPRGLVLPTQHGQLSFCRRMPLGVVGVISPFNFPLYLGLRAVAPALAVGNAVVLKPDPRTTISSGLLVARLFAAAGLPEGVLHVVPGGVEAGEAMCSNSNIAMIQFTGSTAVGRKIGALAGGNLKKLSLELGGKNSLIILDDADIDIAASNAAWGAFLHQGQICMASGRILVHSSIHDEFADRLAAKARSLPVGNPVAGQIAIGPMINANQLDRVQQIVKGSISAGAKLLAGGGADDFFYQPTVLTGVSREMPAYKEEVFGPVASLTSFGSDEEAIELANDTDYGLSAGIISGSVGRAMAIGEQLHVGLLHINGQTVADEVVNPFGGRGQSGNGTSIGGPANWDEFSQWQWVTIRDKAQSSPF